VKINGLPPEQLHRILECCVAQAPAAAVTLHHGELDTDEEIGPRHTTVVVFRDVYDDGVEMVAGCVYRFDTKDENLDFSRRLLSEICEAAKRVQALYEDKPSEMLN